MIIKERDKEKISISNTFFKIYFFLSIFLVILFFLFFFNTGIWSNNKKNFLDRIYTNGLNNYVHIFEIASKGIVGMFHKHDEINLNIPFKNLVILEKNREELIANTKNGKRQQDINFVDTKGSINYRNKKIPITIRLKGDRSHHYSKKDKSSYKITIRGGERLLGIRKFSFIKPRIRNYIHEWLFHELAGEGNLIKLKYKFVNLKFNGENQGLYVLEEGFDKDLIERNKRRIGPIFSVREEFDMNIFKSKLELYNKNFWKRDENFQLANYARNRLRDFIDGKSNLKETFDIKRWAWYFALADLTYTQHGLIARNVKFYYNPISELFEPIPYDGHRVLNNYSKHILRFDHINTFEMASNCFNKENNYCKFPAHENAERWLASFFFNSKKEINSDFYLEYLKAINKITDKKFLSSFFDKREKMINKINSAIYSDYFLIDNASNYKYGPGFYYFSKEDIFYRASILREKNEKKLNKISVTENNKLIFVENNNEPNNLSLVLSELICENFENKSYREFSVNLNISLEKKIEINKNNEKLINSRCKYIKLKDKFNNKIYIKEINLNLPTKKIDKKKINSRYLKYFYKENKNLYLSNVETIIDEDIFIPKNYIVKIKSNEKIVILNKAFIISESAWEAEGNNGRILIEGKKNNFGGGLIIKNAKNNSKFYNTEFKYLSGLKNIVSINDRFEIQSLILTGYGEKEKNNYLYSTASYNKDNHLFSNRSSFTGALNFYNTNIEINNCRFFRIDAEDAVNIISSNFLIENSFFEENSSDAIDVDFGKGIIKNSNFSYIKNDAVDLSGSDIYIENLSLSNIGDKIVSAGENTYVKINKIKAVNSYIGIASKDGSKSYAKDIIFTNVKIPFASYQKKKSYGYGLLEINESINIEKYFKKSVKDFNSEIFINGKKIKNHDKNVIKIVTKNN